MKVCSKPLPNKAFGEQYKKVIGVSSKQKERFLDQLKLLKPEG
jgi:hypothetical protein